MDIQVFWSTFFAVLLMYAAYYALTPGGRKAWKEQTEPKKTKEQYRQEWEDSTDLLKEHVKYYELKKTIMEQNEEKKNKK